MWAFRTGQEEPDAPSPYQRRDDAADVGTWCHAAWEAYLRGKEGPEFPLLWSPQMKDQANRAFRSAREWKADSNIEVVPLETPLVSEMYGFGGTPDAVGVGSRGGFLMDWKSGRDIYRETWLQMAAYLHLLKENQVDLDVRDGVHILRMGKRGGEFEHLHIPADHPALPICWEQFLGLLACYEREKKLKDWI